MLVRIHRTAEVSDSAQLGVGTSVWHQAQIREGAIIGRNCIIGKGVYIDVDIQIGDNVKIQNYACLYHGVTIEDGVFIGPHVCFTNDLRPRAIKLDGSLKAADDWTITRTLIRRGASIGANTTIVCGVTIGEWAMIGSGSTVSRNVCDYSLVWGNPARPRGFVCPCGAKLELEPAQTLPEQVVMHCSACSHTILVRRAELDRLRDFAG